MSLVFYYDLQMFAITCMHILHNRVGVLPIVEDHTVTVNSNTSPVPILEFRSKCNVGYSLMFIYINIFPYLLLKMS